MDCCTSFPEQVQDLCVGQAVQHSACYLVIIPLSTGPLRTRTLPALEAFLSLELLHGLLHSQCPAVAPNRIQGVISDPSLCFARCSTA